MLPEGTYRIKAVPGSGTFGNSSGGKDCLEVQLKVVEGQHEGSRVRAWLYFSTDESARRSMESMRYLGCTFPGDDPTNLAGLGDSEAEMVFEHEEYKGEVKGKVKWINSGGATMDPEQRMNEGQKQAFKSRMQALLLKTKADSGSPAKGENGDIPF